MDCLWGSRFLSVVFSLDLFSTVVLALLLVMAAWLMVVLFSLRLELGEFYAEVCGLSDAMRDARQFSGISSYESKVSIGWVLKAVAREFFVGTLLGAFFSIRVDDALQAKRLQQSFGLVRDDIVHRFCARIERALTLGKSISLLGICAAFMVIIMSVLQFGSGGFAASRLDNLVVSVLLFCFLGAWSYLISLVMGEILRTKLAFLHYEFKRLAARTVLLAEKK